MYRSYDKYIFNFLTSLSVLIYISLDRSFLGAIYLLSLILYLVIFFKYLKVEFFSILGMYILYMFFFVQLGVLIQNLFYNISDIATTLITFYNLIFPLLVLLIYRYVPFLSRKIPSSDNKRYNPRAVFLVFLSGFILLAFYFYINGGIILFTPDSENFRIKAVQGNGLFIVGGMALLRVSSLLEENLVRRLIYLTLAFIFIIGTGFRSQALSLIIVGFIIYVLFNKNKELSKKDKSRNVGLMVIVGLAVGFLYAIIGVYRRGLAEWSFFSLYKPFIWRIYVNTRNFDTILQKYPQDQFMYGTTYINDILTLLPGPQQTFIMKLKTILSMNFAGGSLTPSVFGEGFYNFGYLGIVLVPIFYGILVLFFDYYLRGKVDKKMYFILGFQTAGVSTTGLIPVIIYGLLPLCVAYSGYKIFDILITLSDRRKHETE